MALIVSLTLPATTALVGDVVVDVAEITYPEAYARVLFSRAHADKSYICLAWYPNVDVRLADGPHVKVVEFVTDTPALTGDYFPALYTYLKTLPEFAGAIDHPVVDPAEVVTPAPTQPEAQA